MNPHPISMLDDLLLFICIPSFFLYTIFKMGPQFSGYTSVQPDQLISTVLVVSLQSHGPLYTVVHDYT